MRVKLINFQVAMCNYYTLVNTVMPFSNIVLAEQYHF